MMVQDVVIETKEEVGLIYLLDASLLKTDDALMTLSRRIHRSKTVGPKCNVHVLLYYTSRFRDMFQNELGEWVETDLRLTHVMKVQEYL